MLGFEVYAAADGQEAWDIYKLAWPDFVITDIYMPQMNGITLLNRIKEANDLTQVVLITGYSHYKQLIYKDAVKPDGFITKPFNMQKVVTVLLKMVQELKVVY